MTTANNNRNTLHEEEFVRMIARVRASKADFYSKVHGFEAAYSDGTIPDIDAMAIRASYPDANLNVYASVYRDAFNSRLTDLRER